MSTQDQMPAWLRDKLHDGPPVWLRNALRRQGVGGHTAGAAERAAAWAAFTAKRTAAATRPAAHGRVFASLRDPADVSPLARKIFGAGR